MSNTPRGAPELVSAQAAPETTVNEQIRRTEAGAGRFAVADRVTAPPGTCADGACYIIIATATGAFTGKENQIATAVGTNAASGWYYRTLGTIDEGVQAYVQDENATYEWSGSAWAASGGGVASTASATEQLTGTDSSKASTPDSVAALWEKGSDIASASTISIGEGGFFHVTGTTTITDIDPATDKAGRRFVLVFDGVLTLTYNATTLILPTGADIITAAGDVAEFISEGSDAVRCVDYSRASGQAIVGGGIAGAAGSFFTGWSGGLLTGDTASFASKGSTFNPSSDIEIHTMIAAINATAGGQSHYCQIASVNASTGVIGTVLATSSTVNSLGTAQEWHEFAFSPAVDLTAGTDYIFILVNSSGTGTTVCRFGSCNAGRPNIPGTSGRTQWRYNTIGVTASQSPSGSTVGASYALCLEGFFA